MWLRLRAASYAIHPELSAALGAVPRRPARPAPVRPEAPLFVARDGLEAAGRLAHQAAGDGLALFDRAPERLVLRVGAVKLPSFLLGALRVVASEVVGSEAETTHLLGQAGVVLSSEAETIHLLGQAGVVLSTFALLSIIEAEVLHLFNESGVASTLCLPPLRWIVLLALVALVRVSSGICKNLPEEIKADLASEELSLPLLGMKKVGSHRHC